MTEMIQFYRQVKKIPLMSLIFWDYIASPGAIIAGNTGSGKTYLLKTLFSICSVIGKTIVIDPKVSDLARMTKKRSATKAILPDIDNTQGISGRFLSKVVQELKQVEAEIYRRQDMLFKKSVSVSTDYRELHLQPIFIFIDELAALVSGTAKQIKDDFINTLTRISVLGRESGVYLILSLQSAKADFIPTIVRSQMSLRIQLGRINNQNARFLFPELHDAPMIPLGGKGTGIISIAGDPRYSGIEPFAAPTIKED